MTHFDSLRYFTLTRSDIQFVMNKLSQFISSSKLFHHGIFRELKLEVSHFGKFLNLPIVPELRLIERDKFNIILIVYSDTLIAWRSRKLSRSNTEFEYKTIASSHGIKLTPNVRNWSHLLGFTNRSIHRSHMIMPFIYIFVVQSIRMFKKIKILNIRQV